MLFGHFSRVFGVRKSISGVKKAKFSAWTKMGFKPVERKKICKKIEKIFVKLNEKNLNEWTFSKNISNVEEGILESTIVLVYESFYFMVKISEN